MNVIEFPEKDPNEHENLETNEHILHDVEVVARTLDMVPARSDLGRYLAKPATEIVKGPDGHSRAVDADYSNYDKIKTDTVTALEDFSDDRVGRVKILSGMVNGHIDAHKGSDMLNMRWAFEQLNHFNITGDASFHKMLNKSGEVVGKLDIAKAGSPEAAEIDKVLAVGAAKIRDGHTAVMFDNYKDEADTKMYGMKDPETGELLANTFMVVKSGTFTDKYGTSSNFSNIAFADIVMIPEPLISEATKPQEPEPISTESATEQFDIDKVDWKLLEDDKFKVRRTNGSVDEGGWKIHEIMTGRNNKHYAVIRSWNRQHGSIEKTIFLEELVNWQTAEE